MSTKAFHLTLSDLVSSKSTSRIKVLDAIKDRAIEWPESFEEYNRIILMVCECLRQAAGGGISMSGTKSILVQGLACLLMLVEDLDQSDCDSSGFSDLHSRICELMIQILSVAGSISVTHLGSVEYVFRLLRSNIFASVSSSIVSRVLQSLLSYPEENVRHFELVRSTVWSILGVFGSDFSTFQLSLIFDSLLSLYTSLFGVQCGLLLVHRNPTEFRSWVRLNPHKVQPLIEKIPTPLSQSGILFLRFLIPLLGPINVNLQTILTEVEMSPRLLELHIDAYQHGLDIPMEFGEALIERSSSPNWKDPFWVESQLMENLSMEKNIVAILKKVGKCSQSKLVPNWRFEQIFFPMILNCSKRFEIVSDEISVLLSSLVPPNVPPVLSTVSHVQLWLAGAMPAPRTATIQASNFLTISELFEFVLAVNCEKQDRISLLNQLINTDSSHVCSALTGLVCFECLDEQIRVLRKALVFASSDEPDFHSDHSIDVTACVRASLIFLEEILNSAGAPNTANLASMYILLGSLIAGIRCQPCLFTRLAPQVPVVVLAESTQFLQGQFLQLCSCALHENVLDRRPMQTCSRIVRCITRAGQESWVKSRLKTYTQLSLPEQLALLRSVTTDDKYVLMEALVPKVEKNSLLSAKLAELIVASKSENSVLRNFLKNLLVGPNRRGWVQLVLAAHTLERATPPDGIWEVGDIAVCLASSYASLPPEVLFSEHCMYILDRLRVVMPERELTIFYANKIRQHSIMLGPEEISSLGLPGLFSLLDDKVGPPISPTEWVNWLERGQTEQILVPDETLAKYLGYLFPEHVIHCSKKRKATVLSNLCGQIAKIFIANKIEPIAYFELVVATDDYVPYYPVWPRPYPMNANVGLVVKLFNFFNLPPAFSDAVAKNEAVCWDMFSLLATSEAAGLINEAIGPETCAMIATGISFKSTEIDLGNLAKFCLKNHPETAYWLVELALRKEKYFTFSSPPTLASLFAPPSSLLALLLSSMAALRISLHSLPLTLHASVRTQAAKLRGDFHSLLFEAPELRKEGLAALTNLHKANDCTNNLKNLSIVELTQLCRSYRRAGHAHQARLVADWTTENMQVFSDENSLIFFYQMAKTLFQLGLCGEATVLIRALGAALVHSPAQLSAAIETRAGLWLGQQQLETVEDIRRIYFEKALKCPDVKVFLKSRVRLVKILDPMVMVDKSLLKDEFTCLCEIMCLLGGPQKKSAAWFASRFLTLWFGNMTATSPIVAQFRNELSQSQTLLPFFYQIVGRVKTGGREISNFVVACAKRHLHVCLPPVLLSQDLKLVEAIRSGLDPVGLQVLNGMVAAFKFYLALAMFKVDPPSIASGSKTRQSSSPGVGFPVSSLLEYAEYAKHIAAGHATVLTAAEPVAVKSIFPTWSIADSGKSLPKILKVVAANGRVYSQIVKGNDDLRNDAVLQQLFKFLRIQSYVVVPISAKAGIAEWVTGTTTLGNYLVGYPNETLGAHVRHNPTELVPSECKLRMVQARQKKLSLHATFTAISAKFSPCLNFFFYEHFSTPKSYFAAQSAFSASVAATSVVGFVVGLGDRHPNNILISTSSGEVIHIDYGICFDAGKFLKVPEIVPFRLTRDIVDGLGVLGVHGPFAKTCEDVLISLKSQSELVSAVVEVFVVDPLFNWAVASLGNSDNATKALQGVKRKLQGFMDNISDVLPLTPRAQTDRLIRLATDEANLCLMFAGWQPWI